MTNALVAAGAAVLGSAITGSLTYWAGARAAATSRQISEEDRRQQGLRDAYVTLQQYVKNHQDIADWWLSAHLRDYRGDPPPELGIDDEAQAVSELMASPAVVAAVERFEMRVLALNVAVAGLRAGPTNPANDELARKWQTSIRREADNVVAVAKEVHYQMRLELTGDGTVAASNKPGAGSSHP